MRSIAWIGALALAALACAAPARGGQNANAHARLYWQLGRGPGLADRNSASDSVIQLVVTVRGARMVRGADVQLTVQGAGGLPRAWQAQPGGCADSAAAYRIGGFGGVYPDLFTSDKPIMGLMAPIKALFYRYTRNACVAPDSTGTIWMMAAGGQAEKRDPMREYAVCAFRLDLRKLRHGCLAGAGSADSKGVCIYPNTHIPCDRKAPPLTITLVDGTAAKDFVPVDSAFSRLTWKGGPGKGAKPGR